MALVDFCRGIVQHPGGKPAALPLVVVVVVVGLIATDGNRTISNLTDDWHAAV